MANVEPTPNETGKKGRATHRLIRIDMTPMVDLGFLLITFFMLATTLATPKAIDLNMPAKDEQNSDTEIPDSKALTLILGPDDTLFYGIGTQYEEKGIIDFSSPKNVEEIIYRRQNEVKALHGSKDQLVVLIKAMPSSRFINLVNILDEMEITQTDRFSIVGYTDEDKNAFGHHFPAKL